MPELLTDPATTILHADQDNLRLGATAETEDPAMLAAALLATIRPQVEAYGGQIFKTPGTACWAIFPRAESALAAARAAQVAWEGRASGAPPPGRIRIVLASGPLEGRDGDYYGPAANRSARLLAVAHGGQILLNEATHRQIEHSLPPEIRLRPLGPRALPGIPEPEWIFQVLAPDLPRLFPPIRTPDPRPNNLPAPPTAFLGRQAEREQLADLLGRSEPRLITLTGPGGIGKTRLSQQVAQDTLDDFADGAWFVSLGALTTPEQVPGALAVALAVPESPDQDALEMVQAWLRAKQALLVLDNFEQILAAAPLVGELLAGAPRLRILVTSRARLGLPGEGVIAVSPLATPDPHQALSLVQIGQVPAVALFVERAQAARPDFALTAANVDAVTEICRQLDGLPLALELAAARCRLFAPPALLARLTDRLGLLAGGGRDRPTRQQTLRAAIAWSYDLLPAPAQLLLAHASVFVGGATLPALRRVSGDCFDFAMLTVLIEHHLVEPVPGPDHAERIRMLESIHAFAQEQLAEQPDAPQIHEAHAQYYLQLAETAAASDSTGSEVHDPREAEQDNVRATLAWLCRVGDAPAACRLATAMAMFWQRRGQGVEASGWLERVLALPAAGMPPEIRARALGATGDLLIEQTRLVQAAPVIEEAHRLWQESGNQVGLAESWRVKGIIARDQGDMLRAAAAYRASLGIWQALNDPGGIADLLYELGTLAAAQRSFDEAVPLLEESLATHRAQGNTAAIVRCLRWLGFIAHRQGDYAAATRLLTEGLALQQSRDNKPGIADFMNFLARVVRDQGDYAQAESLLIESLNVSREMGNLAQVAGAFNSLGELRRLQGDFPGAVDYYRQALAQIKESGLKQAVTSIQQNLAQALHRTGDLDEAEQYFVAGLRMYQAVDDPTDGALALAAFATIQRERGDVGHAARWFATAAAVLRAPNMQLALTDKAAYDHNYTSLRARYADEVWEAEWAAGQTLTLGGAIQEVLQWADKGSQPDPDSDSA